MPKLSVAIVIVLQLLTCHSLKAQEVKMNRLASPSFLMHSQEKQKNERDAFEPPPEETAPKQTIGGGSRNDSNCSASSASDSLPLTALVPLNGLGLTMNARPALPVYIPVTTAQNLEFSLYDAHHRGIYQTNLKIPDRAKVVGIKLPKAAPGLEVGREYYWSIALVCDPSNRLKDRVVTGRVKRIQPENSILKQQLNLIATQPFKQIILYQKMGLWYEMMALLIEHQERDPANSRMKSIWRNLLVSSGLDRLINQRTTTQ